MNNLITITAIAYNEEVLMQFFIDHYRRMFPDCPIVIYDNYSTDRTAEIALSNNCTVIKYDSNNEIRDDLYLEIKNNCWKNYDTPWCLQCDIDEICFINEDQLKYEEKLGSTIISFEGWNLITMSDDPDIIDVGMNVGSRAAQYDKYYCFNKLHIKEINYSAGCHYAHPQGNVKLSETKYLMCHFKALGLNYMINRHGEFATRMSQQNLAKGLGFHYLDSAETIRNNWVYYQTHPDNKKVL